MSTFTDSQGQAIAEAELPARLAAGEAFADDNADYAFRDRTGQVVKLKGNQVGEAIGAGFELLGADDAHLEENRARNESGWNTVRTMAERGASVASAGLTDLAAGLASPELARDMRERAEVQSSAAGIGELAGMAVPFSVAGKLAKPVAGLAAKATTPLGRMTARAAAEAAPYALEGALYGASSKAGALALQGEEITAEKVLSGAGEGALLGGLLGVGGNAIARGLRRTAKTTEEAIEALTKSETKGASTARQAIDSVQPSARRIKSVSSKATSVDEALERAGKDYLGYKIKTGPMKGKRIFHAARDPVDAIEDVTHAWNETGKEIGWFRDAADELGRASPDMLPDAAALNQKLDDAVGELSASPYATGAEKRLARRIEREHLAPLREWRERGAADPVEQVQALGAQNLTQPKEISPRLREAYEGTTKEQAQAIATGSSPPMGKTEKIPPVVIELTEAGPRLTDGAQRVSAAAMAGADDILAKVIKPDGSEWTGPVSISGRPVTPDGAPSLSQLDRMRQGVGDALSAAKRAGKKDEIRALSQVYGAFTDTIDSTIERTLGPQGVDIAAYKEAKRVYGSLSLVKNAIDDMKFAQAASRGKKPPTAADDAGLSYALISAMTGNFGSAASAVAGAAGRHILGDGVAGGLAGGAARTTQILKLGAKAIATGARIAAKAAEKPSGVTRYLLNERPETVIENVREVASSPQRLQQYAAERTQGYAQQYPQLAMKAQQTIIGDLQHLAAKAPAAFQEVSAGLTPMAPSKALRSHPAIKAWMQRAAALQDAASVVDAMVAGEVPFEAIETLKERRPGVWAELRQGVMTEVAAQETPVPYSRRVFLGTAFEFAADYTMQPGPAAELQAPAVQPEAEQTTTGRGKIEPPDPATMQTTTDRLEML